MIIKSKKTKKTTLNFFDLLGDDENALSKAFSFVLASSPKAYGEFMKYLGFSYLREKSHFPSVQIEIQKKREEGVTDIEIYFEGKYHIIIECKINKNRIMSQRRKYIPSFAPKVKTKLLCFITQERESNLLIEKGIKVRYFSWLDILEIFDRKEFCEDKLMSEFLRFMQRSYKMKTVREILIQDLGRERAINRFKTNNLYMRDETYGNPLYFAPYFTRSSKQAEEEGISYLSKVLGVLTIIPSEITVFKDELKNFTDNSSLINKWLTGVKTDRDIKEKRTYFFLDNPLRFKSPLLKVPMKDSKKWIGGYIPKNRCVSFDEFIKHIPELM
jgi:hypothetical protein